MKTIQALRLSDRSEVVAYSGTTDYGVSQDDVGTWLVMFSVDGTLVDTGWRGGSREQAEDQARLYAAY